MNARLALAIALSASPAALQAQTTVGTAVAVDGDSLDFDGQRIRLFGIDAPERTQTCDRDGKTWPCGEAAAGKLQSMIEGRQVVCRGRGNDQYGRAVAVCEAGGGELNRLMVAQGWAVAFREFSADYIADETRSKAGRTGIWDSTFMLPGDYRRLKAEVVEARQPQRSASVAPRQSARVPASAVMGRCAIKGNRNRKGQWIYHLPGFPYYEATRAEEIFCSESDAQAAGYRRAIVK